MTGHIHQFHQIDFVPRKVAERLVPYKEDPWAIISLQDTDMGPADLHPNWKWVHREWFNDVDAHYEAGLFSDEQAERIIKFLDKIRDEGCKVLVVHCQAGISRSAAVARFAADYIGCEVFWYKYGQYSLFNKWVYSRLNKVANGW